MKTLKNTIVAMSILAVASMLTTACNGSDDVMEEVVTDTPSEERIPHYATMKLDGSIIPFDATRATTATWNDGDKIYLQFTVGNKLVDGAAIYNATTQEWNVEYYGTLTTGTETKCEAYYFENAIEATHTAVTLNEHTVIYTDKAATYLMENNVIKVTANLNPMTGRIRMKGDASEEYRFSGINHYCTYNIVDNNFASTQTNHVVSVESDGYSAYYYGFFPNEAKKEIFFDDTQYCVSYAKTLGEQALAVGRSGYLNAPSMDNRSGWEVLQFKDVTVSNVTFRMIRVVDDMPSFYIGETEVTQELWKAVMGSSNNPSTFEGTNMPVNNISWDDCQTFIAKLNAKTGMKFRLPSLTEWLAASKGGCISQGYTYSGSNTHGDVAWTNSNSSYGTHPVKQLLPNEIGAYDMSGNVEEWVNDTYMNNGSLYGYVAGGHYYLGYSSCYKGDFRKSYASSVNSYAGLRLAL